MVRLIGPSCEVPWISAGGAVVEPLPSIWMRTFGYSFLYPSAHSVIRLFRVSEPTELRLPETPLVLLYDGIEESTLVTCAERTALPHRATATASGAATRLRFIALSLKRVGL